jgi:hypothetical protein
MTDPRCQAYRLIGGYRNKVRDSSCDWLCNVLQPIRRDLASTRDA